MAGERGAWGWTRTLLVSCALWQAQLCSLYSNKRQIELQKTMRFQCSRVLCLFLSLVFSVSGVVSSPSAFAADPRLTSGIGASFRGTSLSPWRLHQDPVVIHRPGRATAPRRTTVAAVPAPRRHRARLLRAVPLLVVHARATHAVRAPATHAVRGRSSSSVSSERAAAPATGPN